MSGARAETPTWALDGAEKRSQVRRMFAAIAPTYDGLNSVISLRGHRRWRQEAVDQLRLDLGDSALDLCTGTGDFLPPLRRAVGRDGAVAAIDFCEPMLERAKCKTDRALLISGDALVLPFASAQFDAVTVGWGIRNLTDIDQAHREIFRVLKPGGRFVSIDTAMPRALFPRIGAWVVGRTVLPALGVFSGEPAAYTYLPRSTERFWSREKLAKSMESAGFEAIAYRDRMFGGICIHRGKKP